MEADYFFIVFVSCRGIKKRARTSSSHSFKVGKATQEEVKDLSLIQKRCEAVLRENMKHIDKGVASFSTTYSVENENFLESQPFHEKNIRVNFEVSA